MRDSRRAALALIAMLLSGVCAAAESGPLGWLPELAGRCWNNAQFGSQTCYWQSTPDRLNFLSRSGEKWLDCGLLIAADKPPGITSISWSQTGPGESLRLTLAGDTLLMHEGRPAYPEGVDRLTVMTRPVAGRFRIQRQGQYGPGGRRAGQEEIKPAALVFRAGSRFTDDDPASRRCLVLGEKHAQIP
ncbi:MAG: hypothetical protein IPH71_03730 [Proteobacteria bacterium]|nr:hypothetical protein [Pseudomonadota bacterium]